MEQKKRSWLLTSFLSALAAVAVVALAVALPGWYGRGLLLLGVAVFLFVLLRNPAWRYWRAAMMLLGGWLTARGLPSLFVAFEWKDHLNLKALFDQQLGWSFDLTALVILFVLVVCDFLLENASGGIEVAMSFLNFRFNSSQATSTNGNANSVSFGDVSENSSVVIDQRSGWSKEDIIEVLAKSSDANAEIDKAAAKLLEGSPDVAIAMLEDIGKKMFERLGVREKYRIAANVGHCYEMKSEFPNAARFYLEAEAYQKNDPDAQALAACAHAHLGNPAKAFELAKAIVEKYQTNRLAAAVMIKSAPEEMPFSEIESLTPLAVRETSEAAHALGNAALKDNLLDIAEKYHRIAMKSAPNSNLAKELLAATLIKSEEAIYRTGNRKFDRARVEEAISLLNTCLVRTNSRGEVARLRYTRAEAGMLLEDYEQAETDFRTAIEADPDEPAMSFRFGLLLDSMKRRDTAIEYLKRWSKKLPAQNGAMIADFLFERNKKGDREESLQILDKAFEGIASEPQSTRGMIACAIIKFRVVA